MSPRPKNPTKTRHIRLPVELDRWVEHAARLYDRSYNGQVVYILKLAQMGAIISEGEESGDKQTTDSSR